MDLMNKLHFLLYSDDRVTTSALVGVWIHGVPSVSHIIILAVCLKFIALRNTVNRVCKPPRPFLLAQLTDNKAEIIKYFDVSWPLGPSQNQDNLIKYIHFQLHVGADNLDRYYSSLHSKNNSGDFVTTLSVANSNDRALTVLSMAVDTYHKENYSSSIQEDIIPRNTRNQWNNSNKIPSKEFEGLEVPDVSLVNTSFNSNYDSDNSINQTSNTEGKILENIGNNDDSVKLLSKVTVYDNKQSDEGVPRVSIPTQRIQPQNHYQTSKELFKPCYPQMQYFPQSVFTFQPMISPNPNPYMMYSPNIFVSNQEPTPPFLLKPPQPPKTISNSVKKHNMIKQKKVLHDQKSQNFLPNRCPSVANKSTNVQIEKSVAHDISDETNKISKRILQLDREEDLATLENLVQQIINQRYKSKLTMISTGTDTNELFLNSNPKQIVEVSTDLPSFIEMKTCIHCNHKEDIENSDPNETSIIEDNRINENDNQDCNSLNNFHSNIIEPPEAEHVNGVEIVDEDSQQYNELLNNLETYVDNVRSNSVHGSNIEEPNINILEEAVRSLRELDINQDFENHYWESIQSSKPKITDDDMDNDDNNNKSELQYDKESLDTTIIQQRINYVSLFLNNSSILPSDTVGSTERKSSISEQSAFIEELALKYLKKVTTKLDTYEKPYFQSLPFTSDNSINFSVNTKEYLRRHNLLDYGKQSQGCYSSIRPVDGNSLPRSKHLVASTPTPYGQQVLSNRFQKSEDPYQVSNESEGSYVRILDGLKQQPSILPATNSDSIDSWMQKDRYSKTEFERFVDSEQLINVLDVDKLKQLPKYL